MNATIATETPNGGSLHPVVRRQCADWHDHEWKEEYYGTRCAKCGLFFASGCAPWDDETDEHREGIDYD